MICLGLSWVRFGVILGWVWCCDFILRLWLAYWLKSTLLIVLVFWVWFGFALVGFGVWVVVLDVVVFGG